MKSLLLALALFCSVAQAECNGYIRLTFDDGPNDVYTPAVLDLLKQYRTPATFFVIGVQVEANATIVKRMADEGHVIGNHTWSHFHLPRLNSRQVSIELAKTSDAVARITGVAPTEWRPPYEEWNAAVKAEADRQGMTMLLWNYETDSNDWKGLSAATISHNVVTNLKNGSIVLMHDRFEQTLEALQLILEALPKTGLCVTNGVR